MIRKAVRSDEAAVRGCAENAFGRYVAAIGRKPAPMVADFAAEIAAGHVHVAVDDDGTLLGYITFYPVDGHMSLDSLAVEPASSGRGIGKSLVRFCEAEALRLGLREVHLYTNEKMTENLSIYPHLGYKEVDRRTEHGFSRVFFEKRLA